MSTIGTTFRFATHRGRKPHCQTSAKRGPHQPQRHRTCQLLQLMPSSRYQSYSSTGPNLFPNASSSTSCFGSDEIAGPVSERLDALVSKGTIHPDEHQIMAARELDRVYHDLMENDPPPLQLSSTTTSSSRPGKGSSSFFEKLFGTSAAVADAATASLGFQASLGLPGCYMYGGVGCGKTFLMDLLYQSIGDASDSAWARDRQMVHYHKFMLNVHQFMHTSRKEQRERGITDVNLIEPVVSHILQRGRLLCLDEFQVTDVADAMILKEVFTGLWNQGCVLITTSNRTYMVCNEIGSFPLLTCWSDDAKL
jgi:predicted ATPase